MAGVLVKGPLVYEYEKVVKGPSFIRLYNAKGFCFMQFSNISELGFASLSIYKVTSDKEAVSGKTYYIRNGSVFTPGSFAAGCYEADEYEIANVAGTGAVTAEVVSLSNNKKLSLRLPAGIYAQNGLLVSFKTPCSNIDVESLVIDNEEFSLLSTNGVCVTNYSTGGFKKDDIVTVILSLETPKSAVVRGYNFGGKVQISKTAPTDEEVDLWINPDNSFCRDIDETVQENSKNMITSGAVYEYVNAMIAKLKKELSGQ